MVHKTVVSLGMLWYFKHCWWFQVQRNGTDGGFGSFQAFFTYNMYPMHTSLPMSSNLHLLVCGLKPTAPQQSFGYVPRGEDEAESRNPYTVMYWTTTAFV